MHLPPLPKAKRSMKKTMMTTRLALASMAFMAASSAFGDTIKATLVHTASSSDKASTNSTADAEEEKFKQNKARSTGAGMAYAEFSFAIPSGHNITSATLTWTTRNTDKKDRPSNVYVLPAETTLDYDALGSQQTQTFITDGDSIYSYKVAGSSEANFSTDVTQGISSDIAAQGKVIFKFAQPSAAAEMYIKGKGHETLAPTLTITTASELTLTVGDAGMATFCPTTAIDMSKATSIRAYKAAVNSSTVELTKVSSVARGEGVLLVSTTGGAATENVPVFSTTDGNNITASDNAFCGTLTDITVNETDGDVTNYVLSKENGMLGFYKSATTGTKVAAGKAYLPVTAQSEAKSLQLSFAGETTGISSVKTSATSGQYYTLQGVRVAKPSKGIYIRDGKKVMVK